LRGYPEIIERIPKMDSYGWHKLAETKPSGGRLLLYDSGSDHMYISDPNFDIREFTHWQELPRYPEGVWKVSYPQVIHNE
jgi:hypothetical protein